MNFNEFCNEIVDNIPNYLLEYDIEKINIEKVKKNNGIECTGIVILLEGENVAPNIYLDYYYMIYKQGNNLDDILCNIRDEYKKARETIDKTRFNVSFEELREKVFIKLINYEKNKKMLEGCPHCRFLDLAISFRYLVKQDDYGIASAIISNKDIKRWGINVEDLYDMAMENTKRLFPVKLKCIDEYISNLEEFCADFPERKKLYVITNEVGINGATCVLYDDVIKKFATEKNNNLYLLPSSIHEMIILECEGVEKDALEEMVRDINKFVVSEVEFLSNTVYFYDLDLDKIQI